MNLDEAMQFAPVSPAVAAGVVEVIEVLQQALRDRGVDPDQPRKVTGWAAPDGFRELINMIEDAKDKDRASTNLANRLEQFQEADEIDGMTELGEQLGELASNLSTLIEAAIDWRECESGADKTDARETFLDSLEPVTQAWDSISAVGDPEWDGE